MKIIDGEIVVANLLQQRQEFDQGKLQEYSCIVYEIKTRKEMKSNRW